ncbi:MAG TPA: hypothetical protein VN698_03710, partial [Bacteroidia bacterium]|nr:hypothetical protein [Bacteroidia bacterium]
MKKFLTLLALTFFLQTNAQIITTVAGDGTSAYGGDGGFATAAQLNSANGVTIDASGNIYIADNLNNRIRRVGSDGSITTMVGDGTGAFNGDGSLANITEIYGPADITINPSGYIYIADYFNARVRRINSDGSVSTFAGNGTSGFSGDGGYPYNA